MDERRLERLLSSLHETDPGAPVLERLCVVCAGTTEVDGAGVSQLVDGRLRTVAASDGHAEQVETLQVAAGEGPCFEAVASKHPSVHPDLRSAASLAHWPVFATGAADLGVVAAFAVPLITGGLAVGALDLYSCRPATLAAAQLSDAQLLADLAALALGRFGEPTIGGVEARTESSEPWAHPPVVHHASGMVAEQLDIDVDEALLRLRAVAFVTDRPVADIARDVVAGDLRIEAWSDHG